jgi:hypothetical protein
MQFSTGVFNQRLWPGVGTGPLDDCWVLADYMATHAVAPSYQLPTIEAYRKAANIEGWQPVYPDTSASEGGALEHSHKALKALFPKLGGLVVLRRGDWAGFLAAVKAGHCASASVLSSALPTRLQFGFLGRHRITVYWSTALGSLRVLNPLAPAHSRPRSITVAELSKAMAAYPDAEPASALIFPTSAELAAA